MPEKVAAIGRTVLLVDDETFVMDVCEKMLEALDCKVFTASSGRKAIEVYKNKQDEIELVLLDVIMSGMGGGEAFDRMKEINPDVKVIIFSGNIFDDEATAILKRGCSGFVEKPFSLKDLSEKMMVVLEKG